MSDAALAYFNELDNLDVSTLTAIYEKVKTLLANKNDKDNHFNDIDIPKEKLAFFNAVGKISFDTEAIDTLREESYI